jgi:hypothetical protein
MSGDYLYDKSGEPDPEVERLERLLAPKRWDPKGVSLRLPEAPAPSRAPVFFAFAMAAAVLGLVTFGTLDATRGAARSRPALIEGVVAANAVERGKWLQTDRAAARIELAGIGVVDVEPATRVRVTETGATSQRLDLAIGTIHAKVDAPPRLFVVTTPAANAVDLGCAYTLSVDERGASVLHVKTGQVSLEDRGRTSLVPAGASCETRVGHGPGTPYFDDASAALRSALTVLDFGDPSDTGARAAALSIVLAEARERDSLTLSHLLDRVDDDARRLVITRLAQIVPPPPQVKIDEVQKLTPWHVDLWQQEMRTTW